MDGHKSFSAPESALLLLDRCSVNLIEEKNEEEAPGIVFAVEIVHLDE